MVFSYVSWCTSPLICCIETQAVTEIALANQIPNLALFLAPFGLKIQIQDDKMPSINLRFAPVKELESDTNTFQKIINQIFPKYNLDFKLPALKNTAAVYEHRGKGNKYD